MAYVVRPALDERRYRVYFIPGSGCRGLAPIAASYFAGLRAAEVIVPHKQHVDPLAWPGPPDCGPAFIAHDDLAAWGRDAQAFLQWHMRRHPPTSGQPVILVGSSEGAELLPLLVRAVPEVERVVLVGSTGLDPLDALRLQAVREGAPKFVAQLSALTKDPSVADDRLFAGRSVGYWRRLMTWSLAEPLLRWDRPVWMAMGQLDEQVPVAALTQFVRRAQDRGRSLCVAVFEGADHGLQRPDHDDLQTWWQWVESAILSATDPASCAPLSPWDLKPISPRTPSTASTLSQ